MKQIVTLLILFGTATFTSAQYLAMPDDLQRSLDGKRNFFHIMNTVDTYYQSRNYQTNSQLYSEYKKWNRWSWWAVRHLNQQNEVAYDANRYFNESIRINNERNISGVNSNSGQWSSIGPTSTNWGIIRGSKGIGRVDRLAFLPANNQVMLAATPAGGLWRTNNGGTNWTSISSHIPNCGISGVLFGAEDPSGNKIYILTGDGDSGVSGFVNNYGYTRTTIGVLVTSNGGISWNKLGNSETVLNNRRTYKLVQVRNTASTLLAATDNGIYGSYDFGATWIQVPGTGGLTVFDIEQHPTNNTVLYAAIGSRVISSTNSGLTFEAVPATSFNPAILNSTRSAIAVTPAAPNEVYFLQCGSTNSIYKSTNSGNNFTRVNNSDLISGQYSYNCSFAVSNSNTNFLITGGIGISASNNNGSTFPNTSTGIVNLPNPVPNNYIHPDIHDLAFNPDNGWLFAATDGGVFRSTDNGINWTDISTGLQCTQYYHFSGFAGGGTLLAGGSQDNGTAFSTNGSLMSTIGSGDGFAVAFPCSDNDYIYQVENTTFSRFRRSNSTIMTGTSPGTAQQQTFFPNIIAHPTNNDIVYLGYANTIWRSNQKGASGSWVNIDNNGASTGGSGHAGGFAVSAQAPDRLYAATALQLRRSNDQGSSWTTISGTAGWPTNFGVITDLSARNNNADEIWVTTTGNAGNNRVLYSSNAGASWVNLTGTLPNVPVYCIFCTSEGDVYIGTELGVFFMDFLMNDWVPFYNGLPLVPVTDIFVDEVNGFIAAGTFGRGIWQSNLYNDCGSQLIPLTGNIEGKRFYQFNNTLQSAQQMNGSFGNELRLRSPERIRLTNGFRASAGSYLRAVIGPCGQGLFERSSSVISKATMLQLQ